jgi:hypothetical protein
VRFAFADPPYLGCGVKHYGHQHEDASDYDSIDAHAALIERLTREFPECWALSLHTPSLEEMAHLCRRIVGPNRVRYSAWVKPFASFKPGVNPAYAWEPVIWFGGRSAVDRGGRVVPTVPDFVSANITLKKGTSGAKPTAFSYWLFELLGAKADDEFTDVFPGSGAVARAWKEWRWHNGAQTA